MIYHKRDFHGDRCSCRILADVVRCSYKTLTFSYCQAVLKKRWAMECNHGCTHTAKEEPRSEKWHGVGAIDAVKAILIEND